MRRMAAAAIRRLDIVGQQLAVRLCHAVLDDDAGPFARRQPAQIGLESTIVDLTRVPPVVLREGGIPRETLDGLLALGAMGSAPNDTRAPGMLASHYAPQATVRIVDEAAVASLGSTSTTDADATIGLLALDAIATPVGVVRLSAPTTAADYARVLYSSLHEADALGLTSVLAVPPTADGIGAAVIDRLTRAAAGQ